MASQVWQTKCVVDVLFPVLCPGEIIPPQSSGALFPEAGSSWKVQEQHRQSSTDRTIRAEQYRQSNTERTAQT